MLFNPKTPKNFLKDKNGDLAQFATTPVLVVIVAITVLTDLGSTIIDTFQSVVDAM